MQNKAFQVLNRICYAILIPLISIIHVALNRYRPNVRMIKIPFDDIIPFNRYFIIPYMFWFAFVVLSLVYLAIIDCKYYFRLLMSIVFGMLICFVIFYFFPTTVPRPYIYGNDLFIYLVRFIYSIDNPYNCFPSIHVLNALLPTLFIFKASKSNSIKAFCMLSTVSITLSTLFVKQHYIMDAVASIIIAMSMYLLFNNDYIMSRVPVRRLIDFLIPPRIRDNVNFE